MISRRNFPEGLFIYTLPDSGERGNSFRPGDQHLLGTTERRVQLQLPRCEGLQQTNHSGMTASIQHGLLFFA